jgi:prepilin-type N-terminal cleavage/methylation domain-containing protein
LKPIVETDCEIQRQYNFSLKILFQSLTFRRVFHIVPVMLNPSCLLRRAARKLSRGGFTLVELLVVIGIIAILAGVALGPITNGIKQAKHNSSMQQGRQIGQIFFSYATDNTQNGNNYPSDTSAAAVATDLINSSYVTDPGLFVVSGQAYTTPGTISGSTVSLTASNISWSFTTVSTGSTTGGVSASASDLIPLVYFNAGSGNSVTTPFPASPGAAKTTLVTSASPFGIDGIAVFYKGNNAAYIKASSTTGLINNFISANCTDTISYAIAK